MQKEALEFGENSDASNFAKNCNFTFDADATASGFKSQGPFVEEGTLRKADMMAGVKNKNSRKRNGFGKGTYYTQQCG